MLLVVEEVRLYLFVTALPFAGDDYRTETDLHHSQSDYYSLPEVSSMVSMSTLDVLE